MDSSTWCEVEPVANRVCGRKAALEQIYGGSVVANITIPTCFARSGPDGEGKPKQ